jgi:hypothetical protein
VKVCRTFGRIKYADIKTDWGNFSLNERSEVRKGKEYLQRLHGTQTSSTQADLQSIQEKRCGKI